MIIIICLFVRRREGLRGRGNGLRGRRKELRRRGERLRGRGTSLGFGVQLGVECSVIHVHVRIRNNLKCIASSCKLHRHIMLVMSNSFPWELVLLFIDHAHNNTQ